jgi:D-glycero-D-manno-heptose 1,7-bisphosphate phosphatase
VNEVKEAPRRAVFLDRDGVLNLPVLRDGKPFPPASRAQLEISPGAPEALAALREAGFLLYVVTNQPDVARGVQTQAGVEEIHRAMREMLPVDGFYICYHDDRDHCACRKPKPGMLLAAAAEHGISLDESFLVGDRWRDVEAGQRAGVRTVWLDSGYQERAPATTPDARVTSIGEAAAWILREAHNRRLRQ